MLLDVSEKKKKTSYSVYLQSVATFSIAKSVNGSEDLFYKLRLKGETPKQDPFFSFTFHIQITLLYKSLRVVTLICQSESGVGKSVSN